MPINKYITYPFIVFLLSFFSLLSAVAQETLAVGQVLNSSDQQPVPNVNIYFKNSNIGAQSNEEGFFMIRTPGDETVLVFSAVGFRSKEVRLKKGQSAGMQIELKEQNVELGEIMVIPGANPALAMMKKVRELRPINNYSHRYSIVKNEQSLVYLGNIQQKSLKRKIFGQLADNAIQQIDSTLLIPLFMAEKKWELQKANMVLLSENYFSSKNENEQILTGLIGENSHEINFYQNAIMLFNRSFVSPLASTGSVYYNFYLADSLNTDFGKQYQIHFKSKNSKNLAFNGKLMIDSASYALTYIDAWLPAEANLNYVEQLRIIQQFQRQDSAFIPLDEQFISNFTYEILADSLHPKPQLFIHKKLFSENARIETQSNQNFAGTGMTAAEIDSSMVKLDKNPTLRFAKWIADVIIRGYVPVGKVDIGKIQQIARLTDIEGLRMTLPFKTNEKFSDKISLYGYAGYGFKNKTPKYSAGVQYQLPVRNRLIVNANYTNDYRRIDYDYNDFLYRENPLLTGDEDIGITIFGFRKARKLNERKELSASIAYDWNKNIESQLIYRNHEIGNSASMPFVQNTNVLAAFKQQSLVFETRFSMNENVYDNHFQRIYIANNKPVIYAIAEAGKYNAGIAEGSFLKLNTKIKQQVRFTNGQWNYMIEAGKIFGAVPYSLLEIPMGNGSFPYRHNLYNTIRDMEFAFDQYAGMHNELIMNGILFNRIPVVKHLNLRELLTFKILYGSMSNEHSQIMDLPTNIYKLRQPHAEIGVGISNILRLFTLQSVWRLTNLDNPGAERWSIRGSIRASF